MIVQQCVYAISEFHGAVDRAALISEAATALPDNPPLNATVSEVVTLFFTQELSPAGKVALDIVVAEHGT